MARDRRVSGYVERHHLGRGVVRALGVLMTLRNHINAFVRRWVKPSVNEAAQVLSEHARTVAAKRKALHDRLRAELDAGFVGGVKVR